MRSSQLRRMGFRFLRALSVLSFAWGLNADADAGASSHHGIWISSIDRPSTTVRVFRASTWITLPSGASLQPGDRVHGLSRGLITLQTPDRGVVIVAPGTVVEVEQTQALPRVVRLKQGALRGMFGHFYDSPKASKAQKPLRFLIRSRTAVMGVRGTEFLVDVPEEGSTEVSRLLTFEGSVEAAPDEATLVRGEGTPVSSGKKIEISAQGQISSPARIEKEDLRRTPFSAALMAPVANVRREDSSASLGAVPPQGSPSEPPLELPRLDPGRYLPRWSFLRFDVGLAAYRGIRVSAEPSSGSVIYTEPASGPIVAGELTWSFAYRVWSDRLWLRGGLSLIQAVSRTSRSLNETYGPDTVLGSIVGVETRVVSRLFLRLGLAFPFINGFRKSELSTDSAPDFGLLWRFRERSQNAPKTVLRGVWVGARAFHFSTDGAIPAGPIPLEPWMVRAGVELDFDSD